ncbi:MAG: hypothetical protein PVI30_17360 [Myxococcales bacterium]
MTWFNGLQLALAIGAIVAIGTRVRALLFEAPLDVGAFCEALDVALDAGQPSLAREIARDCRPAWAATLALATLELISRGPDPAGRDELDDLRLTLERRSAEGLRAIHTLGRMAGPLAFIGVILELGWAISGGDGLVALSRPAVVSLGLQRALTAFGIGLGTTIVCYAAVALLQRRAREIREGLARVARLLSSRSTDS